MKGIAVGLLLSFTHSLGLSFSYLFTCYFHVVGFIRVWVKHMEHLPLWNTHKPLDSAAVAWHYQPWWVPWLESGTVTGIVWGTMVPNLSYSWLYRSIDKLIKIGYLWIRLNVAEVLLIRYRFLGETKEKGRDIRMPWFKGTHSVSYTDDVVLPGCVPALWPHRFSK